jgi:hypothetical protein
MTMTVMMMMMTIIIVNNRLGLSKKKWNIKRMQHLDFQSMSNSLERHLLVVSRKNRDPERNNEVKTE